MDLKGLLMSLFALFIISLLVLYWIFPFGKTVFKTDTNPEFNLGNISTQMQFYKNMRFPTTNVSYRIENNCSLEKKNEMTDAFNYLQNLTILKFYNVDSGEDVTVSCDNEVIPSDSGKGFFVAGEGGPTKVIPGDNFYTILQGKILLLKSSKCERPNIEIHELLHVLGFDHSKNPDNIMYPISDCSQTIGNEIPSKINNLYSFPSYPDLKLGNVSATIEGRYLNINLTIENIGLSNSTGEKILIYGDNDLLKEKDFEALGIGERLSIQFTNIFVSKIKIEELNVSVETNGSELSLKNNQISLTGFSG